MPNPLDRVEQICHGSGRTAMRARRLCSASDRSGNFYRCGDRGEGEEGPRAMRAAVEEGFMPDDAGAPIRSTAAGAAARACAQNI
ncbi:hypothetical protein [Burkholderia sp. F1]|uniref:hypothetical protein n=1 Tax=Burkholderia sp. F1 TaxID=3366817 RepID=UPI003D732E92